MLQPQTIPYQALPTVHGVSLTVKRLDLVHPTVSGNKFYKLYLNLQAAKEQGKTLLISFGGAYSNHIHALAHAAHELGFQSLGIIRGQELANKPLNPTLQDAHRLGMQLEFISRETYRQKHTAAFYENLLERFPNAYILPEGGSNVLAVKGSEAILSESDKQDFDVVCCAVGTGGTLAGIINASAPHQSILGFAALKDDSLYKQIQEWTNKTNWALQLDTIFGGYGRFNADLIHFIKKTQNQHQLPLEPIYTAKALYRLQTDIAKRQFPPNSRILFIHTGGLQAYRTLA